MAETSDRLTVGAGPCLVCEAEQATLSYQTQSFNYGPEADGVLLSARVPVWNCASCGEQYLDEAAEDVMHEVVCAHLGRLNPRELKAIRVSFGMRQDAFADLTGYGSASIKRWEAGSQIQSESVDKHFRLLASLGLAEARKRMSPPPVPRFKKDFSAETLEQARRFRLRPALDMAA